MTPQHNDIPLSLYIHIPWCERKCPYCDFNSHQRRSDINESAYIDALIDDVDADINDFGISIQERTINTIFIGGGTPSLFDGQSYRRLLQALRARLDIGADAEITLEANPGSSEASKFIGFRAAGINRLSIGVQSFNPSHLSKLGRVHSSDEAIAAADHAYKADFENVNLDLMFGLPSQTTEQALEDLDQALELHPTHLSCYQLTIEPNTLFHHNPPVTPEEESLWDMQEALQKRLANNNFRQYEVSAYALQNQTCQHNLNYWRFGDYLGIGAGAHGKITTNDGIFRRWKIKHPASYLRQESKIGGHDKIVGATLSFEFMLNALRLTEGFSLTDFENRTQQSRAVIEHLLHKHGQLGLIEIKGDWVTPTQFGHNMLNNMLEDYLDEENQI